MNAIGPHKTQEFLLKLDEHLLIDLCTDILAIEGHREIRIMDGPGDGQRDIHSKDIDGNPFLIQSKYHVDLTRSVSAKEIGEVALGMVRLGYKHGIFVTNSINISPQAKRDCLNAYPGFSVDYWDGKEIINKVLNNLVLKGIWYDGYSIDKVSYIIAVPFILRDLVTDKPVQLLPKSTKTLAGTKFTIGRSEIQIKYQRSRTNYSVFGSYRLPKRKTYGEMGSSNLYATEALLTGVIHLDDLDLIIESVKNAILSTLTNEDTLSKHLAVVLGIPSLTPFGGELSGARLEFSEIKPKTYVFHENFEEKEIDWLKPSQKSTEWVLPTRISTLQSDWFRWYNPENDLCLDIYIICPPSEDDRWQFVEQQEFIKKWWEKSLFLLLPKEIFDNLKKLEIDYPTQVLDWDNSLLLCYWLHPIMNLPFMQLSFEPEYESFDSQVSEQDNLEIDNKFEDIKKRLDPFGSVVIEPAKARHMIAIKENDPYPEINNVVYQGKHIGYFPEMIPMPILPSSREFHFSVCWKIQTDKKTDMGLENILNELINSLLDDFSENIIRLEFDDDTLKNDLYIICEIKINPINPFQNTEKALKEITPRAVGLVEKIETALSKTIDFNRATREYWDNEILIIFNS